MQSYKTFYELEMDVVLYAEASERPLTTLRMGTGSTLGTLTILSSLQICLPLAAAHIR